MYLYRFCIVEEYRIYICVQNCGHLRVACVVFAVKPMDLHD